MESHLKNTDYKEVEEINFFGLISPVRRTRVSSPDDSREDVEEWYVFLDRSLQSERPGPRLKVLAKWAICS